MTKLAKHMELASGQADRPASSPFCGLIDAVLVHQPILEVFPGSVSYDEAKAIWVWVVRDLCPDIFPPDCPADDMPAAVEKALPEILGRMKAGYAQASDTEGARRLSAQLGREGALRHLPSVMLALKNRALLGNAQAFGRAANNINDETALGTAMQAMPLQDPALAALIFHAAVGQVVNPTRLITAAIKVSGGASEQALRRSGLGPLIDACVSHAQNQLQFFQAQGAFADVDLVCRALERFHKLARALTGYLEFSRGSTSTAALSAITKHISDQIEPRLKEVVTDLNMSMRRRESGDRLDSEMLLAAVGGVYLMACVRDCRDSLALNSVFQQAWDQSGQALEIHIQRTMDLFRSNPEDANTAARLDAVIKMAEVRFSADYAETLRRARQAAEKRA